MQIQFITTHEEMQKLFDSFYEKSISTYKPGSTIAEPKIVTGDFICDEFKISRQTLNRWKNKGKVPFLQIGTSIRYDLNAVVKALEVSKKLKGGRQYA